MTAENKELSSTTQLRALGFCGVDDSVDPRLLGLIASSYPLVEFGVLFRPDLEGRPRYATEKWVERFSKIIFSCKIKAAAHFCGARVEQVLRGEASFLEQVVAWGFQRVQINATSTNGVDTSRLGEQVSNFLAMTERFPNLEFILQKNEETRQLWEGVLNYGIPNNVSMLVDESKGTGVTPKSFPMADRDSSIGYAGGIGPMNIHQVLEDVIQAGNGCAVWIDMESSLRSIKNGMDVFDLDKCFVVISAACDAGLMSHPPKLAVT